MSTAEGMNKKSEFNSEQRKQQRKTEKGFLFNFR